MTTTTAATRSPQYIAKCGQGHTVKVYSFQELHNGVYAICPCGSYGVPKSMNIKVNEKECGARCMASQGPSCSCSCGGENHGSTHSA